jgi:hypothetical protein
MTTALEGDEESASRPGHSLPPGKTLYPFYRRLGVPQGRSGQVRKISPSSGFDPWTVQPVASRYTDCATRSSKYIVVHRKNVTVFLLTLTAVAVNFVFSERRVVIHICENDQGYAHFFSFIFFK